MFNSGYKTGNISSFMSNFGGVTCYSMSLMMHQPLPAKETTWTSFSLELFVWSPHCDKADREGRGWQWCFTVLDSFVLMMSACPQPKCCPTHRMPHSTEGPACGHDGDGDCDVEMVWGGIQGNMIESWGKEKSHPSNTKNGTVACIYWPLFSIQL